MPSPDQIGRYRVDRRIGSGAFAVVWLAHDDRLEAPVAVKVMADNWAHRMDIRERFLAEARLLRRASSGGVVQVFDVGELDDERPYFVMEYADRGTVADRMATGPLPVTEALRLTAEAAHGAEALHEAGVVHRDIKPSNVLLTSGGAQGRERVLVADLGLAKNLAHASGLTVVAGSVGYMAPEQAEPFEGIDARADIYSLGAVLYHLVTGAVPGSPERLIPLDEVRPGLPWAMTEAVARAMEPDRERRWPTAAAFADELDRIASELDRKSSPAAGKGEPGGADGAGETDGVAGGGGAASDGLGGSGEPGGSGETGESNAPGGANAPGGSGEARETDRLGGRAVEGEPDRSAAGRDGLAPSAAQLSSLAVRPAPQGPVEPSDSTAEPPSPRNPSPGNRAPRNPASTSSAAGPGTPGTPGGSVTGASAAEAAEAPVTGSSAAGAAAAKPSAAGTPPTDSYVFERPAPERPRAPQRPLAPERSDASEHTDAREHSHAPEHSLAPVSGPRADAGPGSSVAEPYGAGAGTARSARSRRRRRAAAIGSAVAVLAGAGVASAILAPDPEQALAAVRVHDASGQISVEIPKTWAKETANSGWNPSSLGLAENRAPGLLVAEDVGRWQDLTSGTSGVFVGLGTSTDKGDKGDKAGNDGKADGAGQADRTGGSNAATPDAQATPTTQGAAGILPQLPAKVAGLKHRGCQYTGSRKFQNNGWHGRIRTWSACYSPGHSLEEIGLAPRRKGKPPVYVQIRCDEDCSARTDQVLKSLRVNAS
ncbi:serine/threonine-protein kinase [Streptomyces oryzae]|uniref:serine/threonine-protein kinase n=1 Tax=Streptomyces oryzae TaxID=1434886 RepID=UPI0027DE9D6B|nr:protein kinase [Streptomyces oryzae]